MTDNDLITLKKSVLEQTEPSNIKTEDEEAH